MKTEKDVERLQRWFTTTKTPNNVVVKLEDGKVVVYGDFALDVGEKIPLPIDKAVGDIFVSFNSEKDFENLPFVVEGNFEIMRSCTSTEAVNGLVGCPDIVTKNYSCRDCSINSTRGFPSSVGNIFNYESNNLSENERLQVKEKTKAKIYKGEYQQFSMNDTWL